MSGFKLLSSTDQVAAHLRKEVMNGNLGGMMPGVLRLEADLGVNRKTIESALRLLEKEGLLVAQGAGRRRRIALSNPPVMSSLRIGIMLGDASDRSTSYLVDLQRRLEEAGHPTRFAAKTLFDLGMQVSRVEAFVRASERDAWVVFSGSREVLQWFSEQPVPAFAFAGRLREISIAGSGPDKPPAMAAAVRRLAGMGHRRIVLLARTARRQPKPGASERAFLAELEANGIKPGSYHLPEWDESARGFRDCLGALFRATPPTALIIDEAPFVTATLQFFARREIRMPDDVSLICTDNDPHFAWCSPSVAHIRWDSGPVVRRIVRWAAGVSRGADDRRQTMTKAEFVEGGTVGPARKG